MNDKSTIYYEIDKYVRYLKSGVVPASLISRWAYLFSLDNRIYEIDSALDDVLNELDGMDADECFEIPQAKVIQMLEPFVSCEKLTDNPASLFAEKLARDIVQFQSIYSLEAAIEYPICLLDNMGRFYHDHIDSFSPDDIERVKTTLETGLSSGNDDLADAVATGFVEAIANRYTDFYTNHKIIQAEAELSNILGPKAVEYAVSWICEG